MSEAEWYRAYYSEQYADSVRGMLTTERSAAEAAFILRETGVEPPATVADIACGSGRHALAFARRGLRVTAVDMNAGWLAEGRAAAEAARPPLPVEFVAGDMRAAVGGPYDLAVSLFHSFGFFSDVENAEMLAGWAACIRPGGWFALDVWNRDAMLRHWQPAHEWMAEKGLRVSERRDFDPLTGRISIAYHYTYADGRAFTYDASFRVYTYTELRDLLASCGLRVRKVFGSLGGDPYSVEARRLVTLAQKGA